MVGISNKIKDLTSIGGADILVSGISAIFWFYVASIIEPEGYGQIAYFLSIAGLGSTLSLFGANRTLMVYPAKGIEIQTTMYAISFILGTVAMLIVYIFVNDFGTSFLLFGLIISGLIIAELSGRKLYQKYAKYQILQRILMIILAISSIHFFGAEGIIPAIALSNLVFLIEIFHGFKNYKINFRLFREKFEFIRNSYFESISGAIASSVDKLIIAPIFGFVILGNYALGLQFFTILQIIPLAAMKYVIPEESSGSENKKLKKYLVIFSIIGAILGFILGPEVISTIFPKFSDAQEVIRIVSLAIIPGTFNQIVFLPKFLNLEKTRIVLFGSISYTIGLVLGIIVLGTYFEVIGIAVAYVLASTSEAIFLTICNRKINRKMGNI